MVLKHLPNKSKIWDA